ncbi:LOW QUALITY PROTEIN: histone H2B-like [Orcinus orca]|uniref:LOW QUALITY PROTEIN: histone H2B-like n=1 Tax=Orcinus orca TaxID=9733 RepID=UPI002112DEFC|nr:LOW QUALITY PROTEIN: histone H2B-like [Orcinus orca]
MHFICLHGLRFPKKKPTIYTPAKEKDKRASSASGKKKRKKKEAYFSCTGKILKRTHPDFSGCFWILDARGALRTWWLERVSLEAVRLSLYIHRRAVTSREILEAVKQRCSLKSLGINEVNLNGPVVEKITLVKQNWIRWRTELEDEVPDKYPLQWWSWCNTPGLWVLHF